MKITQFDTAGIFSKWRFGTTNSDVRRLHKLCSINSDMQRSQPDGARQRTGRSGTDVWMI